VYSQPTGPRSIGGVLDAAVHLYRDSFRYILPLLIANALLAVVPGLILGLNQAAATTPAEQGRAVYQLMTSPGYWLTFLVVLLVNLMMYGALIGALDSVARGARMGLGEALQLGLSRLLRVIGASFLFGLAVTVGFILLVIPGIYLMGIFQLVFVAIILENSGVIGAFGTSQRLIKGHWWRSATILTVAIIILVVLSLLGGVVAAFLAALKPGAGTALIVNQLVGLIVDIFVVGWMPCVLLAMYYDLKLRHEGEDLATRVNALAAR
jgi:hypothetical protein